jgi:hypothetical protein
VHMSRIVIPDPPVKDISSAPNAAHGPRAGYSAASPVTVAPPVTFTFSRTAF